MVTYKISKLINISSHLEIIAIVVASCSMMYVVLF